MRLGEAMVMEGLIDNATLAKALERQIIFGGRIGTNLVEMGAVPEETLAKFLGKVLGVPYAGPERFEEVPKDVLESVPAATVEKYLAFPIMKERTKLHVAMKDPNDIRSVDELKFIVGMEVRPYIASELRITYALEKYYGIKRGLRFISVHEGDKKGPDIPAAFETRGERPRVEGPASARHNINPMAAQAGPQAEAPVRDAAFAAQEQAVSAPPAGSPYEALASPSDRDHIAGAVVSAASAHLSRAVLFMVKGKEATGWRGIASGIDEGSLPGLRITLDSPCILKEVVEEKRAYKGPVLPVPQNLVLLEALGGGAPLEAVVCPLVIKGKVVGVLYGDNGQGSMIAGGGMERLDGIMAKASMSLEILILKNKILADA